MVCTGDDEDLNLKTVGKHADEIKHLYKEPRLRLIMQNLAKSIRSADRDASILFDAPRTPTIDYKLC